MTASADALTGAPVLAVVERSGFVESLHRALAVVTAPDGTVERALGEVDAPQMPRSSNKPVQALAMVRSGLRLPPPLLALASASHSGEQVHQDGVREILAAAGLDVADLRNTPDLPYDETTRRAWLAAGHGEEAIAQNCSGKHAAMLATCVAAGWDTTTYLDPEHPLQRAIAQTLAELAGEPVQAVGVDGCGAPVMAIGLAGLARCFGRLAAAPEETDLGQVAGAIRSHPLMLGGTGRDVTRLIEGVPGLVAKDGAEAVYAAGLPDGRGVALKVADGGQRARAPIMAALLRAAGVEADVLDELARQPVLGHGRPVGSVRVQGV